MVSDDEFRKRFREFLGVDRYLRFVSALRQLPEGLSRLRFWQSDAWEMFVTAHPDCNRTLEELRTALRLCEVHGVALHAVEVPVTHDEVDYASDYLQERAARFPHARMDIIMVPSTESGPTATIWVCPQCDKVLESSRWYNR